MIILLPLNAKQCWAINNASNGLIISNIESSRLTMYIWNKNVSDIKERTWNADQRIEAGIAITQRRLIIKYDIKAPGTRL